MVSAADYLRKVLLSPVYEAARVTPLQTLKKLSERLGNHVSLKREDLQPVHSFKLRGAYHKIATLTEEQKSRGVIAASAGNHAQGVALSAAKLGIKAIIVMPKTTPDIKIDAVRRQGGNVMLFGNSFDEAYGESRRLATLEGYTLIPPFDDVEVIAGQGTIGKELLEQDTHLTHVFVPVGGGGLAAGVAVYIKQLLPDVKVINRTVINAWDDPAVRAAIEKTGRKQLIIAGVSLEICASFPALSAKAAGYDARVVLDASGTFNEAKRTTGLQRLLGAGIPVTDYASAAVEMLRSNVDPKAHDVYNALDMPFATLVWQMQEGAKKS